jgi:hypothetical protein
MIRHTDIKHDVSSVVHVAPAKVVFPDDATRGSMYLDREGLVHLADIDRRRWWMARWVPVAAFLVGVALGAVLVWGAG